MKNHILFICAIFFCISVVPAQSVKKITEKSKDKRSQKTYYVLKEDFKTKHGAYEEKYGAAVLTRGGYDMGERTGLWEFSSYNGRLKFSGSYDAGTKVGRWAYFQNDTLLSESFYSNGKLDSLFGYYEAEVPALEHRVDSAGDGDTFVYYRNGTVLEHSPIINGKIHGIVIMNFENGDLHRSVEYLENTPYTVVETFDREGQPINGGTLQNGSGTYLSYSFAKNEPMSLPRELVTYVSGSMEGAYVEYDRSGGELQKGQYANDKKTGTWQSKSLDGSIHTLKYPNTVETYKKETAKNEMPLVSGQRELMQMPSFQRGLDGLMNFLINNVRYPSEARLSGAQGEVYVGFIVNKEGFIESPEISVSPDERFNKECLRVVNSMPRWNPAFLYGVPVKVEFTLPINFRLN